MKRLPGLRGFLLLIFWGYCFNVGGAGASYLPSVGETIKYDIKKMGVKAGEASLVFGGLKAVQNRDLLLIMFSARSLNFYDVEKIYVEPKTFFPVYVKRELNIFGKKEVIEEHYDQKKGSVTIKKTAGGKTETTVIEKTPPIENIYGFIYRYRMAGKFLGDEFLKLNLPTKDVTMRVGNQETIKAAGKEYRAFYLKSDPKQYHLWFDQGPAKIPLKIDGAIGFGKTSMIMVEYHK